MRKGFTAKHLRKYPGVGVGRVANHDDLDVAGRNLRGNMHMTQKATKHDGEQNARPQWSLHSGEQQHAHTFSPR